MILILIKYVKIYLFLAKMVQKAKIRKYLKKLLPFNLVFHFSKKSPTFSMNDKYAVIYLFSTQKYAKKFLIYPKIYFIEVNTYFLRLSRRNPAIDI